MRLLPPQRPRGFSIHCGRLAGALATLLSWAAAWLWVGPLLGADPDQPQRIDVLPAQAVGQIQHVEVSIEAEGKLKLMIDDKVDTVPMRVTGQLAYDEKRLATGMLPAHQPRSLRYYDTAEATMQIAKSKLTPRLSDDRRYIAVECGSQGQILFSPQGPLTRDELDLVSPPASSLLVDGLLPSEPVDLNKKWPIDHDLLAALLGLDAVGASDVKAHLTEVTNRSAKFELSGIVEGAIDGVSTEMEIKAKFRLNRKRRAIDWFAMVLREKRAIGHAAPGVEAVARVQMKISPIESSPQLEQAGDMEKITLDEHPELALLRYSAPLARIQFLYDRRWHIMGEESDRLAMRYIDRGELLAQCNVAVLPKQAAGKRISLEDFQAEIRKALGENFGQFVNARESADEQGRAVYRVVVRGRASDLPVEWIYRLVADRNGNQVVFVITAEEAVVDHIAGADEKLVAQVRFVEPKIDAAARPTPAAK